MRIKKTKIICTIGPSSSDPQTLEQMIIAGMDVVRLNFSHGTNEEKKEHINTIRSIAEKLQTPIAIIADLQGPKLRLGLVDGEIQVDKGEKMKFAYKPEHAEIPLQFNLAPYMKKGERIFINDGLLEFIVDHIHETGVIEATAQNAGWLSSQKGINIPDTHLGENTFTEKDKIDAEFAAHEEVDYIALSFVQTPDDITPVRNLIKEKNSRTKILVKIEKKEAVTHLEEIINLADGVMVARGDLAIETSASEVPVYQQQIIRLARQSQKPVIVATQMLESMIHNPRPTRAEASDVAHAVLFQVDAVMLSGESAVGNYPVEAVKVMHDIILSVEGNPQYSQYIQIDWDKLTSENLGFNAITSSAASLAFRISAPLITVATSSGRTGYLIASFRPTAHIVAITHDEQTKNQLTLLWGVYPIVVKPHGTSDEFWNEIVRNVKELPFVEENYTAVMVSGTIVGMSGATDSIRVVRL